MKTDTTGWSIALSGSYAEGWKQPHPELDKFCTSGKLNKEGCKQIFPNDMKEGLSFCTIFCFIKNEDIISKQMFSIS